MLHSGFRGIGNKIGSYFIEKAKCKMEQYFIHRPDGDLAYLTEGEDDFDDYVEAVQWAQDYALENRRVMMKSAISALRRHIPMEFTPTQEAINCHHNYVEKENHFGRTLWVTRKGAIRARLDDLGITSLGQWVSAAISCAARANCSPIAPARMGPGVKCPARRLERNSPWPT